MNQYHKIQSLFKRDPDTHKILWGQWSLPEFCYLKGNEWEFTEKIDGTNIRVMWDGTTIRFGGKTDKAEMPKTLFQKLHDIFRGPHKAEIFINTFGGELGTQVCLYGEGYGTKIQNGGKYIPDGVSFILFDIKIGRWWLERSNIEDIATKFNIDCVPIVTKGNLDDMVTLVKAGLESQWGAFEAEGLVARPTVNLFTRKGERIITKLKHADFKEKQT